MSGIHRVPARNFLIRCMSTIPRLPKPNAGHPEQIYARSKGGDLSSGGKCCKAPQYSGNLRYKLRLLKIPAGNSPTMKRFADHHVQYKNRSHHALCPMFSSPLARVALEGITQISHAHRHPPCTRHRKRDCQNFSEYHSPGASDPEGAHPVFLVAPNRLTQPHLTSDLAPAFGRTARLRR